MMASVDNNVSATSISGPYANLDAEQLEAYLRELVKREELEVKNFTERQADVTKSFRKRYTEYTKSNNDADAEIQENKNEIWKLFTGERWEASFVSRRMLHILEENEERDISRKRRTQGGAMAKFQKDHIAVTYDLAAMKKFHEEEMQSLNEKREGVLKALDSRKEADEALAKKEKEVVFTGYAARPLPKQTPAFFSKDRGTGVSEVKFAGGWNNPLL